MTNYKNSDQNQKLTSRQLKILFALIKEYCEVGETCGSKELKEKYGFDFSSATIRNETSYLREQGYLYQSFINGSSSPTEEAYKLFVNQLIAGLSVANKQQQEMRTQILELQSNQESLSKEIAKLVSSQTNTLGFSLSESGTNISGMKHLLDGNVENTRVSEVLDFLDNISEHKKFLLTSNQSAEAKDKKNKAKIQTVFGSENTVLPLGKGYALVATEVMVGLEPTVIGIISPTHLLANSKKLSTLEAISKALAGE